MVEREMLGPARRSSQDSDELESFIQKPASKSTKSSKPARWIIEAVKTNWVQNRWLFILIILLPFTISGILQVLLALSHLLSASTVSVRGIEGNISNFSQSRDVTFSPNNSFSGIGENATRAWKELFPAGKGFIRLQSNIEVDHSPAMTHGVESYCISAFHQMHCLQMMHGAWLSPNSTETDSDSERSPVHLHIEHCYDYLRQAISCASDTALEGKSEDISMRPGVVDGWGTVHQCKNWDALMVYAEKNRP